VRSAFDPRRPPAANRAGVANRSSPIRSPAPSAISATESRCVARKDAGETGAIRNARSSTVRSRRWNRQKRFDEIPQCVGQQRDGHNRRSYLPHERHERRHRAGFVTPSKAHQPEALSHTNPYTRLTVPIRVISPVGLAFLQAMVHERIELF
jgi:hypothetical protein